MTDDSIDPKPAESAPTPEQPADPQPNLASAEPTAEPTPAAEAKRAFRRPGPRARTVLRWALATVLCLGVGAGTALAVMAPARTHLPGLATPSDGRYVYPALQLPELPPGAVGPTAGGAPSGAPGGTVVHAADARQLLLPRPVGAVADPAYPGAKGWVPLGDFAKQFTTPDTENELLAEAGTRHVAATGWRMPDGTHVAVYLLAFRSSSDSQTVFNNETGLRPAVAPELSLSTTDGRVPLGAADIASRPAGKAGSAVRVGIFSYQDITGLLVLTNPKAVNPVDFDQALTLQMELLGG